MQYGNFSSMCNVPDTSTPILHARPSPSSLQQINQLSVDNRHKQTVVKTSKQDPKPCYTKPTTEHDGVTATDLISNVNIDQRKNIIQQKLGISERKNEMGQLNCPCEEELLYLPQSGKMVYSSEMSGRNNGYLSSEKQMKGEDIMLENYANHNEDISDFNASASSLMMSQHFAFNRQLNGNGMNDSFATSSSFSPYIPVVPAKSSSLSKVMPNTAHSASFDETDNHATTIAVGNDGIQSISFDCNNEPYSDGAVNVGCEGKNKYLQYVSAKVGEGDVVNDALDAPLSTQHEWVRANEHMACAPSVKTKNRQSEFESGAEHFCFAPIIDNISKCNN